MPDREKVIKAIDNCVHNGVCLNCEYEENIACKTCLMSDALAMLKKQEKPNGKCVNECECWDSAYERGKQDALKEQEAVEPEKEHSGSGITWWNVCGNCKTAINPNDKYCHECGRPVLWESR